MSDTFQGPHSLSTRTRSMVSLIVSTFQFTRPGHNVLMRRLRSKPVNWYFLTYSVSVLKTKREYTDTRGPQKLLSDRTTDSRMETSVVWTQTEEVGETPPSRSMNG